MIHYKYFILILTFSFILSNGLAQTRSVKLHGHVSDTTGAVVAYANTIFLGEDGHIKFGTQTNEDGIFSIDLPVGVYTLIIQSLGYKEYRNPIALRIDTILNVSLIPTSILLDEINVGRSPIIRLADRYIVNVGDTPKAIGKNGIDILRTSPGIWISEDGDISINGKKGTKIIVNDKLIDRDGEILIRYLENIQAEDIQHIEIIPSSGAEYDANFTGGAIKIICKKKHTDGFDVSISSQASNAFRKNNIWAAGSAVDLKYHQNKIDLYSNFSYKRNSIYTAVNEKNVYNTPKIHQESCGEKTGKNTYLNGNIKLIYAIDTNQSVGIEGNLVLNPYKTTHNSYMETSGDILSTANSLFKETQHTKWISLTGNYLFDINEKGSSLKLLFDYNFHKQKDTTVFKSYVNDLSDSTYNNPIVTTNNIFTATADYKWNLNNGSSFDFGLKYNYNLTKNTISYNYFQTE